MKRRDFLKFFSLLPIAPLVIPKVDEKLELPEIELESRPVDLNTTTVTTGNCSTLYIGSDGTLYVRGDFSNIGGNSTSIARWTGTSWPELH